MDAAERQLLDETVRDAITDATVSGADAAAIDKVLTDLGWLEMLDAEPRDATAIVFTALGLSNAASSALDDVLAAALGVTPQSGLAVVLPAYGSWSDAIARATRHEWGVRRARQLRAFDHGKGDRRRPDTLSRCLVMAPNWELVKTARGRRPGGRGGTSCGRRRSGGGCRASRCDPAQTPRAAGPCVRRRPFRTR